MATVLSAHRALWLNTYHHIVRQIVRIMISHPVSDFPSLSRYKPFAFQSFRICNNKMDAPVRLEVPTDICSLNYGDVPFGLTAITNGLLRQEI